MRKSKKKEVSRRPVAVIDASGLILGRMASHVAKQLLKGEEVVVVNAERAVITGRKESLVEDFKTRLGTRTLGAQSKAPQHPRRPDTYVRRVVRGMLPWKTPKGKRAYGRLKVYIGVPQELSELESKTLPDAKKDSHPSMTVGEFLQVFSWEDSRKVQK